jgi:hypothetical protein
MIVLAILLAGAGLFLLCRLAFHLAVYALPLLAAAAAGVGAHALGAGLTASVLLAALAGVAALAAGHFAMDVLPPSVMRTVVAALFAAPAGGAGYHLAHGLTALIAVPEPLRQVVAFAAALLVAGAAWARLAASKAGPGSVPPAFPRDGASQTG